MHKEELILQRGNTPSQVVNNLYQEDAGDKPSFACLKADLPHKPMLASTDSHNIAKGLDVSHIDACEGIAKVIKGQSIFVSKSTLSTGQEINGEFQQKKRHPKEQPVIRWLQSYSKVLLNVYITDHFKFDCHLRDNGKTLSFHAESSSEDKDSHDCHFSLTLYSRVHSNNDTLHCYRNDKCVTIYLEKKNPRHWPRLLREIEPCHWIHEGDESLNSISDLTINQAGTLTNDADELILEDKRVTLDEIQRGLGWVQEDSLDARSAVLPKISNLNKKIKAENRVTNSNFNEPFTKIIHPASRHCDRDIFNPFKKNPDRFYNRAEFNDKCILGGRSGESMKYDYRREQATMDSSKNTARQALNCKKVYLFLYNILMFVMFLMVNMILSIKGLAGSMDDDSVRGAALIIKLLTYTQLLESVHPVLGLVPGGPFMPFMQVVGRLLVNHFLTEPEIRLASAPYAHYLFIVWSSIEIFRYSFYALRVFSVEIYPITWARYTLFMPLYPMGGFCESKIIMAAIWHYEKTGAYSITLPNAANFSFILPSFLRFYTFCLLGPSISYLMKYMWNQRCKQLKEKVA